MEICNDRFWDWNLTWGNHRPYPEFTQCFQNTVILWLPSILLFLSAPLYLHCLSHFTDVQATRSWKYLTKISVIIVQLSVRYLQLQQEESWDIKYIGLLVETMAMVLLMFYTDLESRKGFVTSGIQTSFWFLTSICGLLLLYSKMMRMDYIEDSTDIQLHKTYLTLCVGQFVLTWLPDVPPGAFSEKECKLASASFIQRIFFIWFNGFMSIGKERPVDTNDISDVMPSDQVEVASIKFEKTLKDELERLEKMKKDSGTASQLDLFKLMIKSEFYLLLVPNVMKAFAIFFQMCNPLITGLLVGFAYDTEQPLWKGYLYLIAGILSILLDRLLNNYLEHLCLCSSIRMDACLKKVIFKKSVKLTNKARTEYTAGEISNILSAECRQVQHFVAYIFWIWCVPCEFILSFGILFSTVNYAAFASVAVLAVVMPLNIVLARKGHNTHLERMNKKDDRIKFMTELLNGIKILKLYAWEMAFGDKVLDLRNDELAILRRQRMLGIIGDICWNIAPFMMGLATFAIYVYISPEHMLTPKTAFQSLATFGMLTHTFNALPHVICHFLRSFVSIRKLEKFLNCEELDASIVSHKKSGNAIHIENGTFTWDKKLGPCLKDIDISIPKGSLVAIVGTVGSGKSSLLSAILGEIDKDEGKVNVDGRVAYVSQQAWIRNDTLQNNILFSNPYREKTYNDIIDACSLRRDLDILTAKDKTEIGEKGINLSGGQKQRVNMARAVYFNADIYLLDDPLSAVDAHVGKDIFEHVISENGLLRNKTRVLVTHGITWLPRVDKILCVEAGRITECGTYDELIGNDGAFSKFIQKYKQDGNTSDMSDDEENIIQAGEHLDVPLHAENDAEIIHELLNAAENHQNSSIPLYDKLTDIDGGFTMNYSDERNVCKFRHSISRSFSMEKETADESLVDKQKKLVRMKSFDNKFKLNEKRIDREQEKCSEGKIIDEDELETGEVKLKHIIPYFKAVGVLVCVLVVLMISLQKFCNDGKSYWIKKWTSDESLGNLRSTTSDSDLRSDENSYYIKIYLFIGLFHSMSSIIGEVFIAFGALRGARVMHEKMLKNVLRGPMSFFDTTPVGRIVHRLSADIEPLDFDAPGQTERILVCMYGIISVFIVLVTSIPRFFIIVIPLMLLNNEIKKQFIPIRRQLSRLVSKQRSPFYSHFSECLNGVHVIRAYDMTENFTKQSLDMLTTFNRTQFHIRSVDRWMTVRLTLINILSFAVSSFFAITDRENLGAAMVGMVISYALDLSGNMEWLVRTTGDLENTIVSIERICQYSSNKQEAPSHTSLIPKKSWPDNGIVEVENYSMRYREGRELILKDININVKSGEKIGIVGRTGAGKSSLTLGLFRLVEPANGKISIDEHDISELGLFDLRSNLIILPQEPVIFSGTLRSNLDPLKSFTDEEIFHALEHAHLKTFTDSLPDKLNYDCGEGGQNLSVGQRQLVCLARSLLRKSHVLVLDEATAAVDMETDALIQETIKREFKECTVLTIAHRLNTIIDYDRILVLDHGRVKEFESPKVLLEDKNSSFYSMAKDAGLVR